MHNDACEQPARPCPFERADASERLATLEADARHQREMMASMAANMAAMATDMHAISKIVTKLDATWTTSLSVGRQTSIFWIKLMLGTGSLLLLIGSAILGLGKAAGLKIGF